MAPRARLLLAALAVAAAGCHGAPAGATASSPAGAGPGSVGGATAVPRPGPSAPPPSGEATAAGPGRSGPAARTPPAPTTSAAPGPRPTTAAPTTIAPPSAPRVGQSGAGTPRSTADRLAVTAAATPTPAAPTTIPPTRATGATATPEAFAVTVTPIGPALAARMGRSWHPGCPVPLSALRYLTLTYRGFDGRAHTGELVVAATAVDAVAEAFRRLYAAGFPIRQMRLVDDFGADDDTSMAADNTSAFNCRLTTSGSGWSQHSYGAAVDVDPVENPYVGPGTVLPPAGAGFVDRPDQPGVIHDGDAAVTAFAAVGWSWGGDWSGFRDYQHFSANGR